MQENKGKSSFSDDLLDLARGLVDLFRRYPSFADREIAFILNLPADTAYYANCS